MSFAALCEAKEVIGMEIVDSAVADAETGQRAADMNYDGKINVNDIVAIINIIFDNQSYSRIRPRCR